MANPVNNNIKSTTASANSTTTVAPTDEIPTNCHTILIYNPDTTNDVYTAEGVADPASALSLASSCVIPPNSSVRFGIGTLGARMNAEAQLVYSTSAGSISVNITYLCTNVVR